MFLRKPIKPLSCLLVLWTLCLCLLNRRYERAPTTLNQSNPHSYELIANFGHKPKKHSLVMTMKKLCFVFISFEYFYPQGSWISGKKYLGVYSQGFFSNNTRRKRSFKRTQRFFLCFFLKPLNSFYHFPPAPPPEVEPPPKLPPEEPPLLLYPPPRPKEEVLRVRLAIV